MSKENAAHLDAAIVNTLQQDTTASRRTIEWITGGAVKLPKGSAYKVLPRKLSGIEKTRLEVDVALENISFVFTSLGSSFVANLHAEVEASGVMSPVRMFEYDYELARKYHKGNGPLVFPVSYAVLLRTPPKGASNYGEIVANDALGRKICNYVYQVRYLTGDSYGTLLGPVAAAAQTVSDATAHVEQILSAMRNAAEGIELPNVRDDYLRHMSQGLIQRFKELSSALHPIATAEPAARKALDSIVNVIETEGRSVMMRNLFQEARDEAREEGREVGREEGRVEERKTLSEEYIRAVMRSLDVTREQAEKVLRGERVQPGVSRLNLGK